MTEMQQKTRLWLDDIRRPPDDSWIWARTLEEARQVMLTCDIKEASLDHDLGLHEYDPDEQDADLRRVPRRYTHRCGNIKFESAINKPPTYCVLCDQDTDDGEWAIVEEPDGVQFARWLVENNLVPIRVTIHSWNPVGAERMRDVIDGKALHLIIEPYQRPGE